MSKLKSILDFSKLDFVLIVMFLALSLFGLLILASASVQFSDAISGSPLGFFFRQLLHFFIGIILITLIVFIPLSFWEKYDRLLLFSGILLLCAVFIPGIGVEVNGANRWIRIAGFGLQPSEVMKFIAIVYISAYSVRRINDLQTSWFGFFRPAVLIVLILSLILMQPDLGTSAVIFSTVLNCSFWSTFISNKIS